MSGKPTSKKLPRVQRHPSRVEPTISMQELESRWMSLHLHVQTKRHLLSLLAQEGGVSLVLTATNILALELKREERKVVRSLWSWSSEELRLLFLHEGCEHVIGSGHILIDVVLAWNLLHGPGSFVYLILPLMALGMPLLGYYLIRIRRRRRVLRRWR